MRRRRPAPPGVLLVDKPAGPSSHAVVDWIRWVLGGAAVGHCGTLDPAATGLLVIVVGAATRVAGHLTAANKVYRARFVIGCSTTTADAEGEIVERVSCDASDLARAREALEHLTGEHELPPPQFSAVKVGGVRSHVRARASEDAEALAPRPMVVRTVDGICAAAAPGEGLIAIEATLEVSKGTYIRSLAELLGRRLERPAHLGGLRRLKSGAASVDDPRAVGPLEAGALDPDRSGKPRWRIRPDPATGVDPASRDQQAQWLDARMLSLREAWPLPWIELPPGEEGDAALARLLHGQRLEASLLGVEPLVGQVGIGRSGADGAFLVASIEDGHIRPERTVLRPNAGAAA